MVRHLLVLVSYSLLIDVIFVIYLYQRWIYRVDKKRTADGFIDDDQPAEPIEGQDDGPGGQ